MTLDGLVWTLFVAAFGGQLAAVGLWWLGTRAGADVKARFGVLSRVPPVVYLTLAILGMFAGFAWGVAAADAGVFPAPGVENLQRIVIGHADRKVTSFVLRALGMPLFPLFRFLFPTPKTKSPPRRRRSKRRRAAPV